MQQLDSGAFGATEVPTVVQHHHVYDVPMVIKDAYRRERLHQIYFGNRPSLVVQDKKNACKVCAYLHQTDAINA